MSEDESFSKNGRDDVKDKLIRYLPWAAGVVLVILGLGNILDPQGGIARSFVAGILFLAAAAFALPPTRRRISDRTDYQFAAWMVALIVFAGFVAGASVMPTTPDEPEEEMPGEGTPEETPTPSPEPDEDGGQADGAQDDETDGTPAEETEEEEPGIQRVAEATFGDHGLVTGISTGGTYAAFAMHTGEFAVYNAGADSFDTIHGGVERQPSHIQLRDDGYATVGWMDAHTFGAVDMTGSGGTEWQLTYEGLWDIDTSTDHSTVAAVTFPDEGPGRVGVASSDGVMVWDQSLEDAAAESVAMTGNGDHVAVGAIEYWTETDSTGSPGVRLYDGRSGDQQWTYETETNVWAVDIHGEQELVAAVTDETLHVLDFDGNVVWETDESSSWVAISDGGTTVVTTEQGKPVGYDAETGEERWRADAAPGWIDDRIAVSEDGDRVVATETVGWTYVADSGEVIWQEEREDDPANVDISADGATWSVIVQDNDTGEIHVAMYRDTSLEG